MSDTAVVLDRVSKRFGTTVAVNDVSLEIHRGEMFGLIGPDGAGKTTTIRLICGLLHADAGRIGVLVRPRQAARRRDGERRLPLAALQPLRRPEHRREHRVLRGDPRRARLRGARDRLLEMTQLTPFRDRASPIACRAA